MFIMDFFLIIFECDCNYNSNYKMSGFSNSGRHESRTNRLHVHKGMWPSALDKNVLLFHALIDIIRIYTTLFIVKLIFICFACYQTHLSHPINNCFCHNPCPKIKRRQVLREDQQRLRAKMRFSTWFGAPMMVLSVILSIVLNPWKTTNPM